MKLLIHIKVNFIANFNLQNVHWRTEFEIQFNFKAIQLLWNALKCINCFVCKTILELSFIWLIEFNHLIVIVISGWNCEQLDFCSDRLGFEAIKWLHSQLDDDANGNIDISESDEVFKFF